MESAPSTGLKSGSHLGAYTVLKRLGEGGMSLVYLAEHSALGRLVAIKILRSEYSQNADAVQRFFLEARAVNQMRHPHIIDIIDFCPNEGGEAYYVMEFMEGADVETLLDRRVITLERGLEIARQAASALDAVHEAGIVHRDFKCGNVFVTTDSDDNDWVKLIDFGIAKLGDAHSRRIGDTLEGVAAGTPEFISPEQAMAKEVDHRSDIYSFGIFLYQMVTGLVPFRGNSPNDIVRAHLYERPKNPRRIKGVPHEIPRALDDLIMRCLAKKPEARPQSMKDIQPELAMLADSVRYEMTLRNRRIWRVAYAASTVGALLVGSAITDLMVGQRPGTSVRGAAIATYARVGGLVQRMQTTPVTVSAAAFVPAPAIAAPMAQPASAPAAAEPASAPALAATPAPQPEETAKADLPRKKKKHRR
ncbi:MAG: serine/threonine protein kinase [Deltaproteobacteria bacterium]|nr:serine/threonine protein kinase [Deltaproteobacteria bacterium]